MSDDLNTALSGFGHPQCKTPRLDELAKRGVRFENMHCQYPVCGSSRASLMTGLYPHQTGIGQIQCHCVCSVFVLLSAGLAVKRNGHYTAGRPGLV